MTYSCTENVCHFDKAMAAIDCNSDLHARGLTRLLTTIVQDIATNQKDYRPNLLDGFTINKDGQDVLRLEREDAKPDDKSRSGFIEYNYVRQDLIE